MGFLTDKILSYSPEVYYKFNQAYTLTPTNLGSAGSSTLQNANETPTPTPKAGPQGEMIWRFNQGNGVADTTITRYGLFQNPTGTTTPLITAIKDHDFSAGFWFKTNYTMTSSLVHPSLLTLSTIGGGGVTGALIRPATIYITGGNSSNSNKGKMQVSTSGSAAVSSYRIDDQQWHYFAIIATPNGTNVTYNFYLDGQFLATHNPTAGTVGPLTNATFGTNVISSTTNYNEITTFDLSDFYVTPSVTIGATEIASIWAEGQKGFYRATKALPTQPVNWWSADEGTSDVLVNYGTAGGNDYTQNQFNLSGVSPTAFNWITGEVEKGIEFTSSWAGWDSNPSWSPTTAGEMTINFWFKKSAPPASAQSWIYRYYNANDNIDSPQEAGIQTNGYMNFKPKWGYSGGPYAQTEVTTQMNVCDGNWHMITITYENASALNGTMKMYVDGVLKDTQADWGNSSAGSAASFSFGAQSTSWDEFQTYSYKLNAAQILSLYQSEYPAPTGAPLTYWNGSAWATPISMKQWNGTAWVTMDGSVYNGSSWLDIV